MVPLFIRRYLGRGKPHFALWEDKGASLLAPQKSTPGVTEFVMSEIPRFGTNFRKPFVNEFMRDQFYAQTPLPPGGGPPFPPPPRCAIHALAPKRSSSETSSPLK